MNLHASKIGRRNHQSGSPNSSGVFFAPVTSERKCPQQTHLNLEIHLYLDISKTEQIPDAVEILDSENQINIFEKSMISLSLSLKLFL